VSTLLSDHPWQLLAALRERTGSYVDRVRVGSRVGWLLLYFSEAGSRSGRLPVNPYAQQLVLWELGIDLGVYRGTFLILGEQHGREAGLTEAQQGFLRTATRFPPGRISPRNRSRMGRDVIASHVPSSG
jgi:hypothetical protein